MDEADDKAIFVQKSSSRILLHTEPCLVRDGISLREIARRGDISRHTLRRYFDLTRLSHRTQAGALQAPSIH